MLNAGDPLCFQVFLPLWLFFPLFFSSQGLLIERTGRRVLLWGGYGVMSATMVMVTVMLHVQVGLGLA